MVEPKFGLKPFRLINSVHTEFYETSLQNAPN